MTEYRRILLDGTPVHVAATATRCVAGDGREVGVEEAVAPAAGEPARSSPCT